MKEQLFEIKSPYRLQGVMSIPTQFHEQKPVLMILNSGLVHRVGACRMSVKLARAMARQGYLVVRFDLSNLGDSPLRKDFQSSDDARICEEIQAVMNQVESQFNSQRFICFGLCSGAQNAFKAAVLDDRIQGIFGVDNFGFKTKKYPLYYYGRKFFTVTPWMNILKKISKPLMSFFGKKGEDIPQNDASIADGDISEGWTT